MAAPKSRWAFARALRRWWAGRGGAGTGAVAAGVGAQGAARYSRVRGGGVEACCQGWRGVVSGGIVSHPSRQQSGGVGTRGRRC